jgi:hypothetical protein
MFNYICWSVVTMCTGAATNFTGLILARFFLGCFEATILPSFVLITQMWWTRRYVYLLLSQSSADRQ